MNMMQQPLTPSLENLHNFGHISWSFKIFCPSHQSTQYVSVSLPHGTKSTVLDNMFQGPSHLFQPRCFSVLHIWPIQCLSWSLIFEPPNVFQGPSCLSQPMLFRVPHIWPGLFFSGSLTFDLGNIFQGPYLTHTESRRPSLALLTGSLLQVSLKAKNSVAKLDESVPH